jgi:gamma-glutamyl:cysteine ligase YbdK (ATP-grasp superfamily)
MDRPPPLQLFEAAGVELEYMIVDRESLAVRPLADRLIHAEAGDVEGEVERGTIAWSNELALHLIEMKTNGPTRDLASAAQAFQENVCHANRHLAALGARLMPSGMHPFMDPAKELRLWPHECGAVYAAFHRIFDCTGHGWANLQSAHLNLPFRGDAEFGRLHAAARVLLPLLPALAASSPIIEGRQSGLLDTRLELYRTNARRVPSVSGEVIPEPVFSRADYEREILGRIYADLAPHDPEGTLRHEWVNARGCIARFDRDALEIRVLDVQECPRADLAIAALVIAVLRALAGGTLAPTAVQREVPGSTLVAVFGEAVRRADRAVIRDRAYLGLFGHPGPGPCTARDLWRRLLDRVGGDDRDLAAFADALDVILDEGCLARRIATRLGAGFAAEDLRQVYGELCRCLAAGTLFHAV